MIPSSSRSRRISAEEGLRLDRVHARVRLVEQQDLGLDADRARDLEPTLVAVRQVAGRAVALVGESEQLEQLQGLDRPAPVSRRRNDGLDRSAPRVDGLGRALERDLDVVEHRQLAEQPDVLERPADAQPRDVEAGVPVMSRPRSGSIPLVGRRNPDSRWNSVVLPAPLGPMTPWIVSGAQAELVVDQRVETAERLGQAVRFEQRRRLWHGYPVVGPPPLEHISRPWRAAGDGSRR